MNNYYTIPNQQIPNQQNYNLMSPQQQNYIVPGNQYIQPGAQQQNFVIPNNQYQSNQYGYVNQINPVDNMILPDIMLPNTPLPTKDRKRKQQKQTNQVTPSVSQMINSMDINKGSHLQNSNTNAHVSMPSSYDIIRKDVEKINSSIVLKIDDIKNIVDKQNQDIERLRNQIEKQFEENNKLENKIAELTIALHEMCSNRINQIQTNPIVQEFPSNGVEISSSVEQI